MLRGKNTKYLIMICIGVMILIASSSLMQSGGNRMSQAATEKKLAAVLEQIDGVSDVTVMIDSENNRAQGVIIVAKGAENTGTKNNISNAAAAALGIPQHKIEVFSKKRGEEK